MLNTTLALDILDVDLAKPENCMFIPVNTVGVMDKGLALDFKEMYPKLAAIYRIYCNDGYLTVGDPCTCTNKGGISGSVVFFPTKADWRNPSELSWIKEGLVCLATLPSHTPWRKQTRNIHIPKLGCGLGGLDWADVRPAIARFADMMPEHEVYLYE